MTAEVTMVINHYHLNLTRWQSLIQKETTATKSLKKQQSSYEMDADVIWVETEVHVLNSFRKGQFSLTETTAASLQVENLT